MSKFWTSYPDIQEELQDVQTQIEEANVTGDPYVDESLNHVLSSNGKMLRPAFMLLGARLGPKYAESKNKIVKMAAAVEQLHMATLIHDDIVDDSTLRRGKPSVQSKYGKDYAVYMGDFLLSQTFIMLTSYECSHENLERIARGVSKMCQSEMRQNAKRYELDASTKNYLRIISGKTAALFGVSLSAGAYETGVPEEVCKKLARIGYNIGMAFQIQDDLLDYNGDQQAVGKELQQDLLQGYYTLPIVWALRTPMEKDIRRILSKGDFTEDSIKSLMEVVRQSGSIGKTKALAIKYTQRALAHINDLPDGDVKTIIEEVTEKLLSRSY